MALAALGEAARDEIEALFPEMLQGAPAEAQPLHSTARHCLRRWETALVA